MYIFYLFILFNFFTFTYILFVNWGLSVSCALVGFTFKLKLIWRFVMEKEVLCLTSSRQMVTKETSQRSALLTLA